MRFCVGLTGGIGSGKSSAADCFALLGAAVVDTDAISHELTRPGGAAIGKLRAEFGDECLSADGALDRAAMRRRVFGDPDARRRLEAVLHPLIRETALTRVAAAQAPYVVVVVPLLLETGAYRAIIQRVLVVDCDEATQVRRTMARSGLSEQDVRAIMAAQLPRAVRLARADDVIHNDGDLEALRRQAAALHAQYLALANAAAKDQ